MLKYGNQDFRNLQEQVGKNQCDIAKLEAGVKIKWKAATVSELENIDASIGDYAFVDAEDDTKGLYLYATNYEEDPDWVFLGEYPKKGLKGDPGIPGIKGDTGSRAPGFFGVTTYLPSTVDYIEGDLYLLINGDVFRMTNREWVRKTSLKGLSGSNVEVIANASGEATNILDTIKIAGVLYKIDVGDVDIDKLAELIEGSEYISVDYNEAGTKLVVEFDETKLDEEPTEDSDNLVKSGGIYDALALKADAAGLKALAYKDTVDYATEVTNKPTIPTKTSDLTNDSGFITASDIPAAPVSSVNTKTGAVVLSASDIKATNTQTVQANLERIDSEINRVEAEIPTKTSDLTNDSGFITSAPVSSVNTKTGAVVLSASDIKDSNNQTVQYRLDYLRDYKVSKASPGAGTRLAYTSVNGGSGAQDETVSVENDLNNKYAPVIPISDNSGHIKVPAPTQDTHIANKSYVDSHHDSTKQDVISDIATIRSQAANAATKTELNAVEAEIPTTKGEIANLGGLVLPNGLTMKELVGVDNQGNQIRIQLGSNLSLDGSTSPYTLNASGGSSGGKIYLHNILLDGDDGNYKAFLYLYSSSSTPFETIQDICDFFDPGDPITTPLFFDEYQGETEYLEIAWNYIKIKKLDYTDYEFTENDYIDDVVKER